MGKVKIYVVLFCIAIGVPLHLFAQPFGNEWVQPNRTYYKIPVTADGVYRLTYETLTQAGLPIGTNPRLLQIHFRGQEVPISGQGITDNLFGPGDYIEFVGQKNLGENELPLYYRPNFKLNDFSAQLSDTNVYFLSVGTQNGKRMATLFEDDPLTPKAPYIISKMTIVNRNNYNTGQGLFRAGAEFHTSDFNDGEGFTGGIFALNQSQTYNFSGINLATNGYAQVKAVFAGRNGTDHVIQTLVGGNTSNLVQLANTTFRQYRGARAIVPVDGNLIINGNLFVRFFAAPNTIATNHSVSVSAIELIYTRSFNINFDTLVVFNNESTALPKQTYTLTNLPTNARLFDFTDPANINIIEGKPTSGNGKIYTSINTNTLRRYLLTNRFFTVPVQQIRSTSLPMLTPILPNSRTFAIISHPRVRGAAGAYPDPVKAYADYRQSPEGGTYQTVLLNIDQVFDMFCYGERNPVAIKNFLKYLSSNGQTPEGLFLIGKGQMLSDRISNAFKAADDMIPTWGIPPSDLAFALGIGSQTNTIGCPVGRLPALNPMHVADYLEKVKETEAINDHKLLWRKAALLGSGGRTTSEFNAFKSNIEYYSSIYEGTFLGGTTTRISKTSNTAVELFDISNMVNKGLSMITMFGHSSAEGTDIEVGYLTDPAYNYSNKGKYPFMLINGCYSGNCFLRTESFLENWVMTPNRGAIASIAHTDLGSPPQLNQFTTMFYQTAYGDSAFIGETYGKIHQELIRRYWPTTRSIIDTSIVQQMLFLGDPIIKTFGPAKPDYQIEPANVWVVGQPNTNSDSIRLAVAVTNYGRAINQTYDIFIKRTYRGVDTSYLPFYFKSPLNSDTVYIDLANPINDNFGGLNSFEVFIDYSNAIDELDENNNYARIEYFVPNASILLFSPKEYSIVNSATVTFVGLSPDLTAPSNNYVLTADTTPLFNSGLRRQINFTSGAVASITTQLDARFDTTVWYWRITSETDPQPDKTTPSSFIYINNGPEGWNQSHFPQFSKIRQSAIERNDVNRFFSFPTTSAIVSIRTSGVNYPSSVDSFFVRLNNVAIHSGVFSCQQSFEGVKHNRIITLTLNSQTLQPYLLPYGNPANTWTYACGQSPQRITLFDNSTTGFSLFKSLFATIKPRDHVFISSVGGVSYSLWDNGVYDQLKTIGITDAQLTGLTNGSPFVAYGIKGGALGSAVVLRATNPLIQPAQQLIEPLTQTVTGKVTDGTLESTLIGPATEWGELHYKFVSATQSDKIKLSVIGIRPDFTEEVLIAEVPNSNFNLSTISVTNYPYLRLRATLTDTINANPAQLKFWRVYYKGVPEGVINPGLVNQSDFILPKLTEGQTFKVRMGFTNVSRRDFSDSVPTVITIFNEQTGGAIRYRDTLYSKQLKAGDSLIVSSKTISTIGLAGNNTLDINVNPNILPEELYENNRLSVPFVVEPDRTNPVLQVTFDGRRIVDGEIVAPSPLILATITDENKYLIKTDTQNIRLVLRANCANCQPEIISLSSPQVKWYPATETSPFRIEYKPKNLANGTYNLQVQGTDASGNASGRFSYSVNFEVINETTITNFFPYPNPFSTNCKFVFTLTGSVLPSHIKIQIMTVGGRIVREITQDELGPIRIGNNISSYSFDGTDEFGDKLATGLYLYKVITEFDGVEAQKRSTSADKYFKNNFGKLYIIR